MRKLIYQSLVTLDGYVGGPAGELDWHRIDPAMHEVFNEAQRDIGAYVMGRRTYEVMRGWDELGGNPGDAPEIRSFHADWVARPKLVFSRTLREVGHNASLAPGTPAEEIAALKAGEGAPIALSGTGLAASLHGTGLIDEYLLFVHPVLLGGGTPLFRSGETRTTLRLLATATYPGGVVRLHYTTAG